MAKYRDSPPQLDGGLFVTDGGIETTLIFHERLDLPHFAAFHLFRTPAGEAALQKYFQTYAALARKFAAGLVLESATWRANADWGTKLGYTEAALAEANRKAVRMFDSIRREYETPHAPVVFSGCVGPRGDGYVPDNTMSVAQAEVYHAAQIETFAATDADMVCAITMNYEEEAIGIARAARRADMPIALSFTVETDGRLPTGRTLKAAIESVDDATSAYPSYYMVNCAHPTHFEAVLASSEPWVDRIRGVRANASRMSHAELNDAAELDTGNPAELGVEYRRLKMTRLRRLNVIGGCCGTDHRHVEQIASACAPLFRAAS